MRTTRESPDGRRGKASPQSPPGPPCAASRSPDAPLPEATAAALQAASFLLDYPADSETHLTLIAETLDELPKGEVVDRLSRFVAWWGGLTPRDREVAYVSTFELGAGACLHLTAKRSRDKHHRGQELIRLRDIYCEHGWEPCSSELPDYLPMVLEFAAATPGGMDVLAGEREALLGLQDSLEASASPFTDVLAAILAAIGNRDPAPERGGPR